MKQILKSRLNSQFQIKGFKNIDLEDLLSRIPEEERNHLDDEILENLQEYGYANLDYEDYCKIAELEDELPVFIQQISTQLAEDEVVQFYIDNSDDECFQADDKIVNTLELLCVYNAKVKAPELKSLTLSLSSEE